MKALGIVLGVITTTLFSAIAYAAEAVGQTQTWWQNLLVTVITAVLTIAVPIISVLLMALVRKYNLKVEQSKIDWVLEKVTGYGEQWVKNKLKDGSPVTGPEILKVSLEYGSKLLQKYNLADRFGDFLAEMIEAKLGQNVVAAGGAKAATNGTKQ